MLVQESTNGRRIATHGAVGHLETRIRSVFRLRTGKANRRKERFGCMVSVSGSELMITQTRNNTAATISYTILTAISKQLDKFPVFRTFHKTRWFERAEDRRL